MDIARISTPTGFETHYLNEQTADVFFVCNSSDGDVRVPAHKILLSSKSPAFKPMFFGDLKETGDIRIPFTADAFKEFLRFFYFGNVNLTMNSIREVVDLLKLYQMTSAVQTVCSDFLIQNLSEDNCVFIFELASLYEIAELQRFCEVSAPQLLTAENLEKCSLHELKRYLQVKQLHAKFNLVEICVKSAQAACVQDNVDATNVEHIRGYLGDIIDYIDFGSMSRLQIKNVVQKYEKFLPKKALTQITNVLLQRGSPCDLNQIGWCTVKHPEKRYINRFETMTIKTNETVVLKAVGFTSIFRENEETVQPVNGQLVISKQSLDTMESVVVLREVLGLGTRFPRVHIHRFKSSVIIESESKYSLQVQLSLRDVGQFYVHSKLIDGGFTLGYGEEILFEGETIIASLGFGSNYD